MKTHITKFCEKMAIKSFSTSTQVSYKGELSKYLRHCEHEKKEMNSDSFQSYLFDLIKVQKLSNASLKQSIAAVKFFLSSALTSPTN